MDTTTNSRPAGIPEFFKTKAGDFYRFTYSWPYCDASGSIIGHVARFDNQTGKQVVPYFKPNGHGFKAGGPVAPVLFGRERLNGAPALVVEGEKCASALHSLGLSAVSAQGGAGNAAGGDWAALSGLTKVYVLPDRDKPGEKYAADVCRALARLNPAPDLKVARLPLPEKGDVVDWIKQRVPIWDGFGPLPAESCQPLREELLEALRDSGSPPADWLKADAVPEGKPADSSGGRYVATPSGIRAVRFGRDGIPEEMTLSNFDARIVEETARDDGAEVLLQLVVEGEQGGRKLPRATISFEQFMAMAWPAKCWSSHCIVEPGTGKRDILRAAIQTLSHAGGIVERRTVYVHTGWRKVDGDWVYLNGNGALGAAGPVKGIEVDLGELARYALPEPSSNAEQRREAAAASMAFLQVAPLEVSLPLLAGVYLAPLAQALNVDFMLWLEAPSQSQKSSISAAAAAHFGATIDRTTLTANWTDSANALEGKLFNLKDALAVIDDYAPQASTNAQHQVDATATRLIRACGNRQGRGRLRADLSQRPERFPRGLVVATAEQWPLGESVNARLFGVTMKRGDVDLAALTRLQADAASGLLARCMADFIQDLAGRFDDVVKDAKQRWQGFRAAALQIGLSGRAPEQVAFLMTGALLAMEYFEDAGLTLPEMDAWKTLMALARRHAAHVLESQPADRFRLAMAEMLASGAAHLEPLEADNSKAFSSEPLRGRCLGWHNKTKQEIYLLSVPAMEAVNEALRKGDTGLNIRPRALWQQCHQRGWLQEGNKTKNGQESTRTVKIDGKSERVLVFDATAFES